MRWVIVCEVGTHELDELDAWRERIVGTRRMNRIKHHVIGTGDVRRRQGRVREFRRAARGA